MRLRCPKCGFIFALSYARTFSCSGCPMSVLNDCDYVRCPNCGHEFPIPSKAREGA